MKFVPCPTANHWTPFQEIPLTTEVIRLVPDVELNHVTPSYEYDILVFEAVLSPPANHILPFQTMLLVAAANAGPFTTAFQSRPSYEYNIFAAPATPASHIVPFHSNVKTSVHNALAEVVPCQVIPS